MGSPKKEQTAAILMSTLALVRSRDNLRNAQRISLAQSLMEEIHRLDSSAEILPSDYLGRRTSMAGNKQVLERARRQLLGGQGESLLDTLESLVD